ncbi:ABC transporter ATP-binding protein [Microvirga antarctica]|uniref:ABC transporter ATP-binding protein n=1 Tax=Microvirga antarctica TaxID=2819233 RepID=UPI001B3136CD|nr:sn-glycerol-3-phosphate ABC transporter ATP-binding protein UgpC [Microvirga antarctica]
MSVIALRDVRKSYGDLEVIHGVNLDIASGEFVVLVGPSGCGKSTLLRMIAGLEEITSGEMRIGQKVVNALTPSERNIAMVFQDYALYPHMTVEDNMAFGLRMRNEPAAEIKRRVDEAADVLKIGPFLDRRPAQLSGGQRQRVAMGRAIVRHPDAFLFDEPLSNLDAALRVEMRLEIAKLHRRMRATTVYVTHDQVEAMTLADRIVVMNAGHMEQVGRPLDLYRRPASLFVARFIGSPTMNMMSGRITDRSTRNVSIDVGKTALSVDVTSDMTIKPGDEVAIGLRAEDLVACDPAEAWFTGEISMVERLGGQTYGYLDIGNERAMTVEFTRTSEIQPGDVISVKGDPRFLHVFDNQDGARLN